MTYVIKPMTLNTWQRKKKLLWMVNSPTSLYEPHKYDGMIMPNFGL